MGDENQNLPAWEPLRNYLGSVRHNLDGPVPPFLVAADEALGRFISNLHNSTGLRSLALVNYSYGSWRTCVLLALTGQTPQVPSLQRHALECALYAHLFKFDEEMKRCWEARHSSNSKRDKFRRESMPRVKAMLRKRDRKLANWLFDYYDHLIDFGGHPNVWALENITQYFLEPGATHGGVTFQMLAGQKERDFANLNSSVLALMVLELTSYIWPTRYQLLGMAARAQTVRHMSAEFLRAQKLTWQQS